MKKVIVVFSYKDRKKETGFARVRRLFLNKSGSIYTTIDFAPQPNISCDGLIVIDTIKLARQTPKFATRLGSIVILLHT